MLQPCLLTLARGCSIFLTGLTIKEKTQEVEKLLLIVCIELMNSEVSSCWRSLFKLEICINPKTPKLLFSLPATPPVFHYVKSILMLEQPFSQFHILPGICRSSGSLPAFYLFVLLVYVMPCTYLSIQKPSSREVSVDHVKLDYKS